MLLFAIKSNVKYLASLHKKNSEEFQTTKDKLEAFETFNGSL
jgi:hypothetical protein